MSVVEDVRQIVQDFLAPEIRTLSAKMDTVLFRVDLLDQTGKVRHDAVMDQFKTMKEQMDLDQRLRRLEEQRSPEARA